MRPEPRKRIPTNPAPSGLNAAFANLNLDPRQLPAGPEPSKEPEAALRIWKMGRVLLRKETARRGGKTVIVVHDFATHLPASVIATIGKKIRQTCGCGGTIKERTIELQLDQPARIRAVLESEGFEVGGVK